MLQGIIFYGTGGALLFQQMILQVWAPCNNTCYMYLDKFDGGGGVKSDKEFKQQNMQKEIKKTFQWKFQM